MRVAAPKPYLGVEITGIDGGWVVLHVDGHDVQLSPLEAQYLALSLAEAATRCARERVGQPEYNSASEG